MWLNPFFDKPFLFFFGGGGGGASSFNCSFLSVCKFAFCIFSLYRTFLKTTLCDGSFLIKIIIISLSTVVVYMNFWGIQV